MRARNWNWPRSLVVVICQFLVLQPIFAQQPGIRIVVVRGDKAKNVIQQIPPETLVVRVEDPGRRPVAGATVVFTAPNAGPSGEFASGSPSFTVTTNQDGLAVADGFHPNAIPGAYQILIRAEFQGQTAMASVAQTNVESKKGHAKLILIVASIVGVAAGAAVIANRRGNNDDTAATITLGGSAVGAPRR